MTRTSLALSLALAAAALRPAPAEAQAPLRKIGEMELQLSGLSASLDPVNPVVPKNTPAGVQVVVRAGGRQLTAAEVRTLVGGEFFVEAELNGPGLPRTITTPDPGAGEPLPADPLILPLPGLSVAGDYELSGVRIVSGGRAVMGVLPEAATLKVIDQVLVTKLVTRPLTLDELKEKGIEITSKDYTGFQFSLALRLESEVVNLDFPVVFDRKGVVVPQPLDTRPSDPSRTVESPAVPRPPAMIVPVMLLPEGEAEAGPDIPLTLPSGEPIRIPSVLVIPGNVGYLKQFFSAVVYVANGTPIGSRLFVRDITGKIQLPPGDDLAPGNADDPLYLAKRIGEDVPPFERPVLGIGPDEAPGTEDDASVFAPGEQGQAEWVLVGNGEGFHKIDIALGATLEGLPTGPVRVKGAATGGVLVRNPFFDVTFTVPSVVREGEIFKAAVTLNNIGQAPASLVSIQLTSGISGLQLIGDAGQSVPTIAAGEAHTFEYTFKSLRTGKVVATYLRFDTQPGAGATGRVDFTIGVTDEGVPLSPDTLVLPASVSRLPGPVTYAAMRVLGQAWSIANAPRGSLPSHVTRMTRATVEQKALALAEAGLRVTLREAADRQAALGEALRDLALDFWGGEPVDPGFDRLLRQSQAGRALAEALGSALGPVSDAAGGAAAFERALAEIAVSGPDFLSLSVVGEADVAVTDSLGRHTIFERAPGGARTSDVPGAVLLPLGPAETAPLLGLVTDAVATGYVLEVTGPAAITLTAPQAGAFVRGSVNADGRARLAIDLARPGPWVLEQDRDGDGTFEEQRPVATETLESQGPELVAAAIIGPETLPRAGDFGLNAVLVFDRPVDAAAAGDTQAYAIPDNAVAFARPQLSGRMVFATLDRPEGPNVPTTVSVTGLADRRGVSRSATLPLQSRLERGGAWVSGQVREADGTPVEQGSLVYSNIADLGCALGGRPQPLARLPLGPGGSYEIRYVRQGPCGFAVTAADPGNVELRRLEARVRRPGERMFLDVVLLGEGSVEGFVRDLSGAAVAGATVAATSGTDKYRGGSTLSDGSGHYRIDGLPVGLVSVKAGRGGGLGNATGRIERAGTAAQVNVTLDAGAVTVSGHFQQVKDGTPHPVGSALVTLITPGGVAGYAFTDEAGLFRFEGMPVGSFTIQARGYGPFGEATGSAAGSATAGQSVTVNLAHLAAAEAVLGRVSGRVVLPSGAGAPNVIVARDISTGFIQDATGTDADGHFVLDGLPTGTSVSLGATTLDRRRKGHASFVIPPDTREVSDIRIELSAIGTATFTVLAPDGALVSNQEVSLLGVGGFAGVCRNPCGCRTGVTGGDGRVSFADLPLGAYSAQAVRRAGGFTEAATGTAVITSETVPGSAVIRLLGPGTVRGSVSLASPNATFTGGSVSLSSRQFVNDGLFTCGMVTQESHRGQVNPGTSVYEFKNVAIGPVSVTGRADIGVATKKGNLARAGDVLTLDLVFVDTIAGVLSGQVFLPSGVPAGAGVEVTVNGPLPDVTVTTDALSRFEFARVLPEGSYSITARDPLTGGVVRQSLYLRRGQDLQHDLRLKGRGTVRVRVEDALGQAVDRAFVTLREQDHPRRRHDRSIEPTLLGVATFEDVFEGPFSVEVSDLVGRGGRGSGAVPEPGATVDVTVSLNPTGTLTGSFLMPDATTPIPYALVTLRVNGRVVGQTTTPGTGELVGRYSFDYVPAGAVRVEAEDPLTLRTGFATGSLESGGALELPVIAKGLGTVTGEVRARLAGGGEETRPGASVRIEAGSYRGATLADATGAYEFGGVPEGPVTVTASVGAEALAGSATGSIVEDGQALALDVYLRDAGSVTGRVRRSDGETPAPPSRVTIDTTGIGGGRQVTYTTGDGVFSFDQVATGRATLTAEELGGIDRGRASVDVTVGANDAADVRLNGVGTLVVKARDADGQPIEGDVWLDGTGAFPWQQFVRVPASGEFRLAKALAGTVTAKLRAQPGAVQLFGTASGEVGAGQESELVVTLAPSGVVKGRILRAGTLLPAYGADVALQLDGVGRIALQADENGVFTASGVPLVAFDLRASDAVSGGIAVVSGRRLAAGGETVDLGDIVLDETAPLVSILEPADGSTQAGTSGPIVIELHDAGSGLDLDTLALYYSSGQAQYRADFQVAGDRATGALRPGALAIGSNTLRVRVKDQSGRIGEAEVTFRVLGATIRGRVLPAAGSTAAGALVKAAGRTAVADGTGAFAIAGLRGGTHYVTATDPQTGLDGAAYVTVADGGEASVDLQLPAFVQVSGTVKRRSGQGVAGVRVTVGGASPRQADTDANGFYALGALPLGTHVLEAIETATGDRGRATITATASGALSAPIELNGIGSLSVSVKTAGGAPVAGARVTLTSSSPFGSPPPGMTGPGGAPAVFPKVFAGVIQIAAAFDGLSGSASLVLGDGEALSREVALEPVARIEGVVSEATTGFAVGATVKLTGPKTASTSTQPSPPGFFAFDNVPLGAFTLEAETSRGDRGRTTGTLAAPDVPVSAPLRLNGLGRVKVSVTTASNAPVTGAQVTLSSSAPFTASWSGTSAAGIFDQADVLAGEITATVRHPSNGSTVVVTGTLAPDGLLELLVTLDPTATLIGRVVRAGGSPAVPGAVVTIVGGASRSTVADANGAYTFADLPLGTYTAEVRVDSRLRARIAGIELDENGETVSRDLELVVTGRVAGTVTKGVEPVAAASVQLTSHASPWGGLFSTTTDASGVYAIDDVPAGDFDIVAFKGSDRREASGTMPGSGGEVTVNLVLQSSAVTVPAFRGDANGFSWTLGRSGGLDRHPNFPSGVSTPRLIVEHGLAKATFTGPCPATGACSVPSQQAGRELVFEQADLVGVRVVRRVFVPEGGYFVRIVDFVTNPGAAAVTVNLALETELGSSFVRGSSSGDTSATAADRWLVLDDGDTRDIWSPGGGAFGAFAPVTLAGWGEGGTPPAALTLGSVSGRTRVTERWDGVTLAPGETRAILHFVAAQSDLARATATGERLAQLPPEALAGLQPAEAAAILNFDVPADLVSAVPALPANDGFVDALAYSGDRATTFRPGGSWQYRSSSPYYGQRHFMGYYTGGLAASITTLPASGVFVPRGPFQVTVTHSTAFGQLQRIVSGDFAAESAAAHVDVVFEGTGTLRGVVTRADGTPISGGSVVLSRGSQSEERSIGTSGEFEFAGVPADASYTLQTKHSLFRDQVVVPGLTLPGPCTMPVAGRTCEAVTRDLVFAPLGAVEGVVRTAANFGIRAQLELISGAFTRTLYSDSVSGAFRVDDVLPGPYTLRATDVTRSQAQVSIPVEVTTGPDAPIGLALHPVGTVQVTATSGPAPLANAAVQWETAVRVGTAWGATTNGAGAATVTNVAGAPLTIRVLHPANPRVFGEASGSITAEAQVVGVAVDVPEVGSVSGQLLARDGQPVAYTVVKAMNDTRTDYWQAASSGATGAFSLSGVPRGPFFLRGEIDASGLWSAWDEAATLAGASLTANARVPAGVLAGRETHVYELATSAGAMLSAGMQGWAIGGAQPLGAWRVELYGPDGRLAGQADGTGSFVSTRQLPNVAPGVWRIAARSMTDAAAGGYRVGSMQRDLTHVFRPYAGGMVEVRVTRGALALDNLAVTIENARTDIPVDERQATGATDAAGLYRVPMRAGPITARVVDPATGLPYSAPGELALDGTLRLAIDLPLRPTTLTGIVTNGDGQTPLPAYVQLLRSGAFVADTQAGPDGAYLFDDVPPGSYTLRATFVGPPGEATLTLTGGAVSQDIRIPIPVVRGRVVEPPPDGSGVAFARVELCFTGGCSQVTADAAGGYVFYDTSGAPPAHLRAYPQEAPELPTANVALPWPSGFTGTVVQELVLPESARLMVTVKDADGNLVANARVEVYEDGPGGARLRTGEADGQGIFRARFAAGGPIRVYAEHPWQGIPGETRGALTIGAELAAEVQLAPSGTLDVAIVDGSGDLQCGDAVVQSIEQRGEGGGVWSRELNLCGEGPTSATVQVPVGPYRVFAVNTSRPGAMEGELAEGELQEVRLLDGTHVSLPHPLPGDEATFVGDASCPPPCSGFAHTRLEGAIEDYPPVARPEGRSLRGLQVAASGVRARRVQYAPPSGAFGRTLTLVSNHGTQPATVALDTALALELAPTSVVTPGGGPVDPSRAWAVVAHASGLQGLVLGSALAPAAFEVGAGPALASTHSLGLEAGQTKALLTFTLVGTGSDTGPLAARAASLATLGEPGALFGLTNEERAAIVNFALPPAGDLRVWVAMGEDAIVGATVGLLDGTGALVAQAETTSPDGTALFAGLAPGSYAVVAVDGDGRPGRTVVDVPAGTTAADTVELDLELLSDAALGGLDVSAAWQGSGDPAAAVALALSADGWSPVWQPTASTDENGFVSFGLVPPGPIRVGPASASLGGGVTVPVAAGPATPLPLVLEPFATLTGQVTAGDGNTPVANAPVTAVDAGTGDVLASGRTDASGSYRLDLRPGASGVRIRAASPYHAAVTVESGVLAPAVPGVEGVETLVLPVGVIEGSVRLNGGGGGFAAGRVIVVARDSSGRSALGTVTEEEGWVTFRIVGPVAGPVVVTAIDVLSGDRASEEVELDPAVPASVYFSFEPEES